MKKFLSVFFVVFMLISPGPFGLRPANAAVPLAAVAVGAVIAASGVMVAGATVYKPPTFDQANAVVDSVTGDIKRKVVVARMFAEGVSGGLRGFSSQYTLDFPKVTEWVKAHPASYPALLPAVLAADIPPVPSAAPSVGTIYSDPLGVTRNITSVGGAIYGVNSFNGYPTYAAMFLYAGWKPCSIGWQRDNVVIYNVTLTSATTVSYYYCTIVTLPSDDPLTIPILPPAPYPQNFADSYPQTEAGQDETDKIPVENPASIQAAPQPMTAEQIAEAMKQIQAEMSDATADAAEAAAAADPTNTALQIAAEQARLEANKDAVTAEAESAQVEVQPEEKTDTPPPSGPALDQDLQIDLSPFLGLKDKAMGKFPFSAVSSLGSIFSGLTADPVTPSMDMPMPWGLPSAKISLSKWDDFAVKWRFLIAMMFHASCIYAIVRRYS